ncbi:MAG TPA: MbnP family protein [Steroidobacteraceae bacterium]|nr:MbnP family protein [Steroidobacteraceae bacterium]
MTRAGRRLLVAAAVLAAVALGAALRHQYLASRPGTLTLRLQPFVGGEPLVANEMRYANPGGDGRFEVRDFQFFLSNVRLTSDTGEYVEPDSYHLVRFDSGRPEHVITLRDVPRGDYHRIEFGIGVDPAANHSVEYPGDLDPNGRMAWTWDVGFKFVLLEGALLRDGKRSPLVYHVGFDENYRPVTAGIDAKLPGSGTANLDLRVDVLRIFTGDTTVDMAALPKVVFDREDAALLAKNYAAMITPR